MENLKYMITNGHEEMTTIQIVDAYVEAMDLIKRNEKLEKTLREIQLYKNESNDDWIAQVLKMIDNVLNNGTKSLLNS